MHVKRIFKIGFKMLTHSAPLPFRARGLWGGAGGGRHGAGGRAAAETRWRWGTRFLNVHFVNIGYSISGIGRMQEGLEHFFAGRG